MSSSAGTPISIPAPVALPSLGQGRRALQQSVKRVLTFLASWRSGTDLVRDPFSAEHIRD